MTTAPTYSFSIDRGDDFDKKIPLSAAYGYFDSYLMTFRSSIPAATVTTDEAPAVLYQASSEGDDPGITEFEEQLRAKLPAGATNEWPFRVFYDVEGIGRAGDAGFVRTVVKGEIKVLGDITRLLAQPDPGP